MERQTSISVAWAFCIRDYFVAVSWPFCPPDRMDLVRGFPNPTISCGSGDQKTQWGSKPASHQAIQSLPNRVLVQQVPEVARRRLFRLSGGADHGLPEHAQALVQAPAVRLGDHPSLRHCTRTASVTSPVVREESGPRVFALVWRHEAEATGRLKFLNLAVFSVLCSPWL